MLFADYVDGSADKPEGHVASFLSHQNYIASFAYLAGFSYMTGEGHQVLADMISKVRAAFPRNGPIRTCDTAELVACLNRAWGTEMILAMGVRYGSDDEFVRIANSWGCVQLYYVGYSATQALIVATGHPRPESHPKTQDQAIALWANRSAGVAPFSFAANQGSDSNFGKNPTAYLHGPGRDIDLSQHAWAGSTSNAWDTAAIALRSTRKSAIAKAFEEARDKKLKIKRKAWEAEAKERVASKKGPLKKPKPERANLSRSEKEIIEKKIRAYGYLDYLYRLRIKANYEETEMFTEGPTDQAASRVVAMNMIRIATSTMAAHETRIAQLIGKKALLEIATDWVSKNACPESVGIGLRLPILDERLG